LTVQQITMLTTTARLWNGFSTNARIPRLRRC